MGTESPPNCPTVYPWFNFSGSEFACQAPDFGQLNTVGCRYGCKPCRADNAFQLQNSSTGVQTSGKRWLRPATLAIGPETRDARGNFVMPIVGEPLLLVRPEPTYEIAMCYQQTVPGGGAYREFWDMDICDCQDSGPPCEFFPFGQCLFDSTHHYLTCQWYTGETPEITCTGKFLGAMPQAITFRGGGLFLPTPAFVRLNKGCKYAWNRLFWGTRQSLGQCAPAGLPAPEPGEQHVGLESTRKWDFLRIDSLGGRMYDVNVAEADAPIVAMKNAMLTWIDANKSNMPPSLPGGVGQTEDVVINGGFDSTENWEGLSGEFGPDSSPGWIIALSRAFHLVGSVEPMTQAGAIAANVLYRVTYTVLQADFGGVRVSLAGTLGAKRESVGTFTEDILASASGDLSFIPDFAWQGSIDTVSVLPIEDFNLLQNLDQIDRNGEISRFARAWNVHPSSQAIPLGLLPLPDASLRWENCLLRESGERVIVEYVPWEIVITLDLELVREERWLDPCDIELDDGRVARPVCTLLIEVKCALRASFANAGPHQLIDRYGDPPADPINLLIVDRDTPIDGDRYPIVVDADGSETPENRPEVDRIVYVDNAGRVMGRVPLRRWTWRGDTGPFSRTWTDVFDLAWFDAHASSLVETQSCAVAKGLQAFEIFGTLSHPPIAGDGIDPDDRLRLYSGSMKISAQTLGCAA